MDLQINTTNPQAITYHTEELGFIILGGIRLEGLDRMRVTLKIEVIHRKHGDYPPGGGQALNNPDIAALAIRHNLDLYNDGQVEKLIRKTAERLEVGTIQITKAIADITAQLEQYRLRLIEAQEKDKVQKLKILTEEEKQQATRFLQQPGLLFRTNELIGKSGVTGEENNRLLMYLIYTSRKRENPLHIISFGSSGAGKSHLQEKVAELIPDEDKIESTSFTSNALYYFGEYDLQHKLILIEDMDGAEGVLYALRELISKRHIIKLVPLKDTKGITKTITFKVTGPVTVAGCTTREKVYEDNANRSFLLYIDESKAQDEKIMEYQRKKSAGTIHIEEENGIKQFLQNTQRMLQPVTVRNPYAERLKIPADVFRPRRTNAHYLQFIEVVTFYHQYQRRWIDGITGEIVYDPAVLQPPPPLERAGERLYIETTLEDIAGANKLRKEVLLRKADELSGACRNYFEQLKQYLQEKQISTFTNKDIRQGLRISVSTIKRYHAELQNCNYIKRNENPAISGTGKKTKAYHYEVVSYEEYRQLQERIGGVLDDIYDTLSVGEVQGETAWQPKPAQSGGEPVKTKKGKASGVSAQQNCKTHKRHKIYYSLKLPFSAGEGVGDEAMKQLPVITPAYRYIEKSFKEWLDVLGYAESSVYYMPIAIREFLYHLEQQGNSQLQSTTAEAIKDYYYNRLKVRTNQRYHAGALSNEHLNKHLQALKKFCQYLRQSGRLQVGNITIHSEQIEDAEPDILTEAEVQQLYKTTETMPEDRKRQPELYECFAMRDRASVSFTVVDCAVMKAII